MTDHPVAIGGLGGSGTRAVAMVLKELSFFIGSDLNKALDNLWFTLLFKHAGIGDLDQDSFGHRLDHFRAAMTGAQGFDIDRVLLRDLAQSSRVQHDSDWLKERAGSLLDRLEGEPTQRNLRWGWKEPNTHVVLHQLVRQLPGLRYIHVIRDGLDMAFSRNRYQISFWGRELFDLDDNPTPRNQLHYWCRMHQRLERIIDQDKVEVMLLPYESFCSHPRHWIERLTRFLPASPAESQLTAMVNRITTPPSIGRHLEHSLADLDPHDVEYALAIRAKLYSEQFPGTE